MGVPYWIISALDPWLVILMPDDGCPSLMPQLDGGANLMGVPYWIMGVPYWIGIRDFGFPKGIYSDDRPKAGFDLRPCLAQ